MSPFKEIYRDPSGEEVSKELSCPGLHRILKEPKVYIDVTQGGEGSLWFLDQGLRVVRRRGDKSEEIAPKIPLERSEGTEVVVYDATTGQEQVRIAWEPSEEEKLREIRKRVWGEIQIKKENRWMPMTTRIFRRWSDFRSARRADSFKNGKLPPRERNTLIAMGVGVNLGAGVVSLIDLVFVYPVRRLYDWKTGYWSKERARLTEEYLKELEAERQSS